MNKKTVLATAFIAVLLFSALVGVQFVRLAAANFLPPYEHLIGIYIRSDGSVDPSTAPVQRVGDSYVFIGNVATGIAVQRSNMVIDGKGYKLVGGGQGTGLYLQSANNVIIQNVNIQGFNYGFYLDNSNGNTIKENTVTGCGIKVTQNSRYNKFIGNTVDGGLSLELANDNIIAGNNVIEIDIRFSNNITVENNKIASSSRVDYSLLFGGYTHGIYLDNSGNCKLFGNIIERKGVGIDIWHCHNLTLSGNVLRDNQCGFKLKGSDLKRTLHRIDTSNTINGKPVYYLVNQHDLRVPSNAGWIAALNCTNITVENWTSTPNWDGVLFAYTKDSRIVNSNLTGNFHAIMLRSSSNCLVSENLINKNLYCALYFDGAVNFTVTENVVINNYCIFGMRHDSKGNKLFHNNFINNGWVGAFDRGCQNTWDNGKEGNYWSNYNGTDNNGDGISDTPYVINQYSNSTDRYPLMNLFSIPSIVIPPIETPPNTKPPTAKPTIRNPTGGGNSTSPAPESWPTPQPSPSPPLIAMPEEYINYTISRVNGSLWAKVDGTYPLHKIFGAGDVFKLDGVEYAVLSDELPMVYPTPPGTTNISVKMNETELNWSNYTETHPKATHHTAIGDWPMIYCKIDHIPDYFILTIHYEHPISLINGSYTFLYDLNISPYLSPWGNKSTAYFNIRMETNCTNLNVYTVRSNGTRNPMNYTITKENTGETITLQIVSEYSKPLLGDLVISFTEAKAPESTSLGFLGTTSPIEYGYAIVAVTVVAIAAATGYLFLKRIKSSTAKKHRVTVLKG